MEAVAQGRVWLGSEAKDRGLVDELGGFETALQLIKKRAGIPANENVSLSVYPPRRSLFDVIVKHSQENMLESKLQQVFGRVPFHAWMQGGFLRMMPYWLEVR
jgi:protease IV